MSKKYTSEELKDLSKEALIVLFLSMQDQFEQLNNSNAASYRADFNR